MFNLVRAKAKNTGETIFGELVHKIDYNEPDKCYVHNDDISDDIIEVYRDSVCNYTGVDDMTGKLIYLNDIVEYRDEDQYFRGVVIFTYGAYGLYKDLSEIKTGFTNFDKFFDKFISFYEILRDNLNRTNGHVPITVIGNIFDDKELLN